MKVLLTLHLIAAVFLVGPAVGAAMTAPAALRSGKASAVGILRRLVTVYGIGTIVVAILGAAMVQGRDSGRHFAFSDTWIIVSLILYVVALVTTVGALIPALRRAEADLTGGAVLTSAAKIRISVLGSVISALYVAIVVLMVYRP